MRYPHVLAGPAMFAALALPLFAPGLAQIEKPPVIRGPQLSFTSQISLPPLQRIADPCGGQPRRGPGLGHIPPGVLGFSCNSGLMNGAYVTSINGQTTRPVTMVQGQVIVIKGEHLGNGAGGIFGFFPTGSNNGMGADILSWSDTEIQARLRVDPNYPNEFHGRMIVDSHSESGTAGDMMITIYGIRVLPTSPERPGPHRH